MIIKYSELRRDYTLDYEFDGEIITATYEDDEETTTDTFDFSELEEGDRLIDVDTEIPVKIINSAERIDGELRIKLMKPYGAEIAKEVTKKGDDGFPFSRDWQEVG